MMILALKRLHDTRARERKDAPPDSGTTSSPPTAAEGNSSARDSCSSRSTVPSAAGSGFTEAENAQPIKQSSSPTKGGWVSERMMRQSAALKKRKGRRTHGSSSSGSTIFLPHEIALVVIEYIPDEALPNAALVSKFWFAQVSSRHAEYTARQKEEWSKRRITNKLQACPEYNHEGIVDSYLVRVLGTRELRTSILSTSLGWGYKFVPMKVYLVVSEVLNSEKEKKIRRVVCQAAMRIAPKQVPEFGIYRTSVIVGQWNLVWQESSICFPSRACHCPRAIACIEVGELSPGDIDSAVDKLADIVLRWNLYKKWKDEQSLLPSFAAAVVGFSAPTARNQKKKKNKKNDHHADDDNNNNKNYTSGTSHEFTKEVLRALGIDLRKRARNPALLASLMDQMQRGKLEMRLPLSQAFRCAFQGTTNSCNARSKSIRFEKHRGLDYFISSLLKRDPALAQHFPREYELLRSFDAAMWLQDDGAAQPQCPCGAPSFTKDQKQFDQEAIIDRENDTTTTSSTGAVVPPQHH